MHDFEKDIFTELEGDLPLLDKDFDEAEPFFFMEEVGSGNSHDYL